MKTNNTNNNTHDDVTNAADNIANARFIELLNLCVDDQLTPAEAAELDAALLASPARRRTYEQYCRMQKACAQLFDPAQAPVSPTLARSLADAERKLQRTRSTDTRAPLFTWWRGLFAIGSLAAIGAAACIALVLHTRAPDASRNDTGIAVTLPQQPVTTILTTNQASAPDTQSAAVAPAITAPAPVTFSIQSMAKRFHFPSMTTFSGDIAPDDSAIAWTKDVQLRPITKVNAEDAIESLSRIAKPQISSTVLPLPAAPAPEDADEMTAFQFRK